MCRRPFRSPDDLHYLIQLHIGSEFRSVDLHKNIIRKQTHLLGRTVLDRRYDIDLACLHVLGYSRADPYIFPFVILFDSGELLRRIIGRIFIIQSIHQTFIISSFPFLRICFIIKVVIDQRLNNPRFILDLLGIDIKAGSISRVGIFAGLFS